MRWNVLCKIFRRSRSRDPSSGLGLGSSSSTCSSSTCSLEGDLGEALKISGDWTKKSIEEQGATIEGIYGLSRKRSKTKEVDREVRK